MSILLKDLDAVIRAAKDVDEREELIKAIYNDKNFLGDIKSFVMSHNGTSEDYEDLLNDSILLFIKSCIKDNLNITTNLKSYLFGVVRNQWYSKLRRDGIKVKIFNKPELEVITVENSNAELLLISNERSNCLNKIISLLGPACRKVLTLWANNLSMKKIAKKLSLSSEGAARKKKYDCMKNLNKIFLENPTLKTQLR